LNEELDLISVMVDSVPCTVKSSTTTQILCITGEKVEDPAFVAPTLYEGQQGVKRVHVNNTAGVGYSNYQDYDQ
jgi:hypothetical protein